MAEFAWYQEGPADGYWPPGHEPARATPIGDAAAEPLGIYLGSQAMEVIELNLETDAERPVAGLLVGFPLRGPRRPFVLVTDLIPFPVPSGGEGEIRFSPALFDEILPLWQERRDGASIVGWCHASPGRGIALSNFHRFNHHRHFPRPWQVALVIDTQRHASLLYRWDGEELVPCEGFYYWDMRAEPAATLFESPLIALRVGNGAAPVAKAPKEKSRVRRWIWLLIAVAALGYTLIPQAPGSFAWMSQRLSSSAQRLTQLRESLDAVEQEQERLRGIAQPAGAPSPSVPRPAGTTPAPESGAERNQDEMEQRAPGAAEHSAEQQGETKLRNETQTAAEPNPLPPGAGAESAQPVPGAGSNLGRTGAEGEEIPRFSATEYVIQPGDTMWSISRTLLGDPRSYRELAESNQIENPDVIFPGQRLVVPQE